MHLFMYTTFKDGVLTGQFILVNVICIANSLVYLHRIMFCSQRESSGMHSKVLAHIMCRYLNLKGLLK